MKSKIIFKLNLYQKKKKRGKGHLENYFCSICFVFQKLLSKLSSKRKKKEETDGNASDMLKIVKKKKTRKTNK